ncbi:MAG: penicillin-binding protein 1B [Gammaproteobacteria bacterium]
MAVSRKRSSRRTRRAPRKRTSKSGSAGFPRLRFLFRHVFVWSLLAFAAYALWLDHEVARTFETRRWSLPARVFARPLELYVGAEVSRARLLEELDYLGYTRVGQPRRRGQYAAATTRVEIRTRGFRFWDFPEPARVVQVSFADGTISGLAAADDTALDLMRLEPAEIGRINPRRFEDRKLLAYDELPPLFVQTLIAVEDRRFAEHHGVDVFGLARAMASNLRAMRWVQGGSTLTQQLVKNFYLTRERTFARKFNEMIMAVSLELRYEKRLILETYVNEVFLGQDGDRAIHGFGLAAEFYFGRPLAELAPDEMALLIGMVKGPSVFDPRRRPGPAAERRNVVLQVMARRGLLDEDGLMALSARPIRLRARGDFAATATPAFMGLVRRQLRRDYSTEDLNTAGLNIYTTLDPALQADVERAVQDTITSIERERGTTELQTAMVVVAPASGEVLALLGDRRPGYAGFNRALDARRPVGSVIKPFVFAAALAMPEKYTLATLLDDRAVDWTDPSGQAWQPRNFDGREYGAVSMLDTLTRSLNLATVDLGLRLGPQRVRDALLGFGVPGPLPAVPSIVIGAVEMSPLELAELASPLANDGFRVPLRAIVEVTDRGGAKLNRYGLKVAPVMTPATAALVRHAMQRVVARGTARGLADALPGALPLAGKTGTSDDNRDSWFLGFGANLLGVAWVGRDDNAPTGLTGSSGALRVWRAALAAAGLEPLATALPAALSLAPVDLRHGVIIPSSCDNAEEIPLHERSTLPVRTSCNAVGAMPEGQTAPRERGLFERLRGLFR